MKVIATTHVEFKLSFVYSEKLLLLSDIMSNEKTLQWKVSSNL